MTTTPTIPHIEIALALTGLCFATLVGALLWSWHTREEYETDQITKTQYTTKIVLAIILSLTATVATLWVATELMQLRELNIQHNQTINHK